MEIGYKDLKNLFLDDPSTGIGYSQIIMSSMSNFDSFQDFYNYHSNHSHVSTCQNEWINQISISCVNCRTTPNSCVCLECFLNGNHEGHEYFINSNSSENCDCGDLTQWKRSGFCGKHRGLEEDSHPENYIDEKLRNFLTDVVFKSSFKAIQHLPPDDISDLSIILQFLRSFLKFGDGFRRLIAISLTERINFEKFIDIIFNATIQFNHLLVEFLGYLINDQLFRTNFASVNYKITISKFVPRCMESKEVSQNLIPFNEFLFHSYTKKEIEYQIEKNGWDWVNFAIQILTFEKELFKAFDGSIDLEIPFIFFTIAQLRDIQKDESKGQTQKLFDLIFSQVLTSGSSKGKEKNINDTIISTSFKEYLPNKNFIYVGWFNIRFFVIFEAFKSKKDLKLDKLFDELDKNFDISSIYLTKKNEISKENDKFVSRYLSEKEKNVDQFDDYNYLSIQQGSSFFISNPIMFSLMHLLRVDNFCRVKIARFLSTEKYQCLRVQLGISTLKSLVAMSCYQLSLIPKYNQPLDELISIISEKPTTVSCGIPLLIPLLQLTIGIECNENDFSLKEFFAFEIAREIGIFDRSDETNDKMNFLFLYLVLLIVIERTLFNFDGYEFIKEQIIFELKQNVSDLNQLFDLVDLHYVDDPKIALNKVISEVAVVRQNKNKEFDATINQDISFKLKDDVEFKIISAINSIKRTIVFMNEEIFKNQNKLLRIQSFESEEISFFDKDDTEIISNDLNIKLREFLFTPTVLAIVYKSLRRDSTNKKNNLNEHLAMNIIALASRFIQESEIDVNGIESSYDESTVINYDSTLFDLITQIKRVIFNYKEDEEGVNASIQNTLNRDTFDAFMNIKIGSSSEQPKSLINLLLEKGEIGRNILAQMDIEMKGVDSEQLKKDSMKIKKLAAKKLKLDILNHFKAVSSSFNVNDEDNDNDDDDNNNNDSNTDKEVCSFCNLPQKNEVLSYPLYFYRTKFPFIIDKPPLVKLPLRLAAKEIEVHEDETQDTNSVLEDINEDEEYPTIDELFVQMISQRPEAEITDEIMQEIQLNLSLTYEEDKRLFYESKNRRKEANQSTFISKRCTPGNNYVVQFNICQHLVHHSCVNRIEFTCPIDRASKNGLLPNIDDLPIEMNEDLSNELKSALNLFIIGYSKFINQFNHSNDKIIDVFVELIKSISGLISTFEIRLRSLPDCLDSKKTKFLSRNLFLSTWHAYRMKGKPKMMTGFVGDESEDVESKLTVFQRFIKSLIESDDLEKSVEKKNQVLADLVSSYVKSFNCENSRSEKELFLFLRRVCYVEHFLLLNEKTEKNFIDWDEILSSENLAEKYKIQFNKLNGFEFRPFIFAKMPKEFLRFAQFPYNFPVENVNQCYIFNMLDYNNLILIYDDFSENDSLDHADYFNQLITSYEPNIDFKSFVCDSLANRNSPGIGLLIGKCASDIFIVNENKYRQLRSFYLDKYGCTDTGFSRGLPLFLNEERYEKLMDQILSGEFINGLISF